MGNRAPFARVACSSVGMWGTGSSASVVVETRSVGSFSKVVVVTGHMGAFAKVACSY